MKRILLLCLFLFSFSAHAFEDPTRGKPFLPWLWNDQFEPTLKHSLDLGGIGVLAGGAAGTIVSHQYDDEIAEGNARGDHLLISKDASGVLSTLGGGGLGIGITAIQLFVDQKNGLKHGRAIALTALSHVTLALIAHRARPAGRADYLPFKSSWPSGHASSAFATAESLAYAYGWWVGVPMNALAIAISAGRVSENAHWLSDVVSGAALGIFWAHASNNVDEIEPSPQAWQVVPTPFEDGLGVLISKRF
jgi:hypothetical protein